MANGSGNERHDINNISYYDYIVIFYKYMWYVHVR